MKLVTWIVKLYPRAWQERYEIEMMALLEEHQITFLTVCDLLFGVVDARLDPHYRTERNLLAFKDPRIATLAFFATLAMFLFLVAGNEVVITQGAITLFSLGQPIVPNHFTNTTVANNVLTILELMMLPIIGSLCLTTMFVAFASMKRIIAGRHIEKALFAAVCFVIPVVIMLHLNILAPYGMAHFIVIRGNSPFAMWLGLESLMGMLLLTILKSKQAIATRRKGMLFLVILIDALLVLRAVGFLPLTLVSPRFPFMWHPLLVFTLMAVQMFPFTAIGVLLLALAGSKFSEWTSRLVLAAVGLVTPTMIACLLFFLVGSFWTQTMSVYVMGEPLYNLFSGDLLRGIAGVGLLLCTLLALAVFRTLLLTSKRTLVTKEAIQELPPMEMRQ